MNRNQILAAAATALALTAPIAALAANSASDARNATRAGRASAEDTVRTISQQFDAANLDQLELEFPVGELIVDAWDRPQVQIEVRLECERQKAACREAAEAVKLASSTEGKGLELELKGWPKSSSKGLEAHVQIHAPRGMAVDAELGVGELRINGMANDVQAELGVGNVSLNLPQATVATVSLEAGVGDASLSTADKKYTGSGFVGKELRWKKGAGLAAVHAECGVGDVKVALR
jgi:hypothetical protein